MHCAIIDVVRRFACAKRKRAIGCDLIGNDVLRLNPTLFGFLYHPVMLKAAFRIEEPIWWKGGSLCELFKKKGSMLDCDAFRDVIVEDVTDGLG